MTFHFAHLAPPGADTRPRLAARWVRCPLTRRLVMHWDRPAIPVQPEAAPVAGLPTGLLPEERAA